ncbi:glycosyltransferase family 2 protein [Vibrio sp. IRLE0018]|uniref:glycosyltransferase family 2 protein n=1 Tax=Vibrio floridensis TaxID=2908007 RepID=UPI001F399CED|nr:glycosyltransferase family 2 protein [Vibrio floridensis]MCF8780304.1 glycosyltransferase family 2 protein [Vibrio floridensis]
MSGFKVSIVTPTYNRAHTILRSVNSSLSLVKEGLACEVIIVDDCSQDNTVDLIKKTYLSEISDGKVKIIELSKNIGVTGAKNKGASKAIGDWVAFMDSDDIFLDNVTENLRHELLLHECYDLVFFRCSEISSGCLIGDKLSPKCLSTKDIMTGVIPGECLPLIKTNVIQSFPYHEDLRGCESISYLHMAYSGCKVFLSDFVARGYETDGSDRLSTRKALISRADKLLSYNIRKLRYIYYSDFKTFASIVAKICYYSLLRVSRPWIAK